MSVLDEVVATCGECGAPIKRTDRRVSVHGAVDFRKYIGGGAFDVLLKQSGYVPDGRYGHGGTWGEPMLLHLRCAARDTFV